MSKNILVASRTGSGKTTAMIDLAIELVKSNDINVLFAVPDSKIASEMRQKFESAGIKAFILSSHESIFGHQKVPPKEIKIADFDCPYFEEIQTEIKLGVQSSSFKEEYCAGCPFADKCYYPEQYSNVMDEKYKVVIIQHAHFSASEVIYELLAKNFQLIFIDETFIQSIFEYVEIHQTELDILESKPAEWTQRLFNWMKGDSRAIGKLEPSKEELEVLYEDWKTFQCEWRIPDLIRHYNQHRIINDFSGIEVVHELPHLPIRVFTDATPPVELIKHLTGIENLEIFGQDEIIDIKSINPDNHRYQVYDSGNSKRKLAGKEYFTALMNKACQLVKDQFIDRKTLFTVYKSDLKKVIDFITELYPEILPHIDIGLMSKGTNKWAHYDFQIIMAGRYRIGKSYWQDTYKYKAIANYYREKKGLELFQNPYPVNITDETTVKMVSYPVKVLQRIDDELKIVTRDEFKNFLSKKYEDIGDMSPNDPYYWFNLIDELDAGEMTQVERIRWVPEVAKLSIHMHSRFMKDLEVEPLLFEEYLQL